MPYSFHAALTNAMPLQRASCVADDTISQSSPVKRKPAEAQVVQITGKDIADKRAPHFRELLHQPEPDYKIAILLHRHVGFVAKARDRYAQSVRLRRSCGYNN